MIILIIIFFSLFHIVGDIMLQTKNQEIKDLKSIRKLLEHVTVYSFVMIIPLIVIHYLKIFSMTICINDLMIVYFTIIFITHFLIDLFVGNFLIKYRKSNKFKKYYLIVQIDQFLHYLVLFITLFYIYL